MPSLEQELDSLVRTEQAEEQYDGAPNLGQLRRQRLLPGLFEQVCERSVVHDVHLCWVDAQPRHQLPPAVFGVHDYSVYRVVEAPLGADLAGSWLAR